MWHMGNRKNKGVRVRMGAGTCTCRSVHCTPLQWSQISVHSWLLPMNVPLWAVQAAQAHPAALHRPTLQLHRPTLQLHRPTLQPCSPAQAHPAAAHARMCPLLPGA